MLGPVVDRHRVARAQLAVLHDAQVRAGAVRDGEPLDPPVLAEAARERRAGRARLGDLEERGAHGPPLADDGLRDRDALHAQVLAEQARRDVATELAGPPVRVVLPVRVHRLLLAAVVRAVGLQVGVQPEPAHLDRPGDGPLVDRRDADGPRVRQEGVHAAHREDLARGGAGGEVRDGCGPGGHGGCGGHPSILAGSAPGASREGRGGLPPAREVPDDVRPARAR